MLTIMNECRSIFIKCECDGEGLGVDYDVDDAYYYFSYWSRGFRSGKLPFWQRVRYSFHLLFTGKPFNDELVLNRDSANKLCDFLKGIEMEKLESEYGKSSKN